MDHQIPRATDIPMAVVISGGPGSGKSTLACALAETNDWVVVSFGDYLRFLAHQRQVLPNRANLQNLGEQLVRDDHKGFTKEVLSHFGWIKGQGLIVEGVRHFEVVEVLRSITTPLPLIWIFLDTPNEIQEARVAARDPNDPITQKTRLHTTEAQIANLQESADYVVDGRKALDEILSLTQSYLLTFAPNAPKYVKE